jgi:hypothetical protein
MMQALFIATVVVGLLYFLFAKRRFDLLSVAFFSGCAYFLPGFFGYTNDFAAGIDGKPTVRLVDLLSETYLVFVLVLATILLSAVVFDLAGGEGREVVLRGSWSAASWAVLLSLAGFAFAVASNGEALLSPDKDDVVPSLDRWHTLWAVGASLGAALSFKQRRWFLFSVSMALLLADLFVGSRSSLAITVIAVFMLWLSARGPQRLALQSWKIGAVGVIAAYFFFAYKRIYIAVKSGRWDLVAERLADTQFYVDAVTKSEPFVTQTVLNEIIAERFYIGMGHFSGIVNLLVPFSPILTGRTPTSFNNTFQPALFPQQTSAGMASNIWGEMLSSGGWPLLVLFVAFFALALAAGSYVLRARDPVVVGGAAVLFTSLAFYVHRHDLLSQINDMRNYFLLWLCCVLLAMLGHEVRCYVRRNKALLEATKEEKPSGFISSRSPSEGAR